MPAKVLHTVSASTTTTMRTLYFNPQLVPSMPSVPCVLQVTPLLRELILVAVDQNPLYENDSAESRIISVILDQLLTLSTAPLSLPMPEDRRLRRIAQALLNNPSDTRSLASWANRVGSSERTVSRLYISQTGMSFAAWRQQRRLLQALEWLARGKPVTRIAMDLGYASTSAFTAMFRRAMGVSPTRYFKPADQLEKGADDDRPRT